MRELHSILMVAVFLTLVSLARAASASDEGPEQVIPALIAGGGVLTADPVGFSDDPDPSDMTPADTIAKAIRQPEAEPLPSEDEAKAAEEELIAGPEVEPEKLWFERAIRNWHGEVRLGSDFYSGTVDRTRIRGGFDIHKEYDGHKTSLRTDYSYARTNLGESENRLVNGAIQDWATGETKFSGVFARATGELDRFKAYEYRLNLASGGRYQIVKDEKTNALMRIGLSATREFEGPRDEWVPEGAFFLSVSHTYSKRQKIAANVDYFPELEDPSQYRVHARASWDYLFDEESGLRLRVGVEDRYDKSVANAEDRNEVDLRADLVWQF